ncbi:UNVERIFIED_CONTAM: hypothetical protein FKN15_064436 [Acipenser sinensis]
MEDETHHGASRAEEALDSYSVYSTGSQRSTHSKKRELGELQRIVRSKSQKCIEGLLQELEPDIEATQRALPVRGADFGDVNTGLSANARVGMRGVQAESIGPTEYGKEVL